MSRAFKWAAEGRRAADKSAGYETRGWYEAFSSDAASADGQVSTAHESEGVRLCAKEAFRTNASYVPPDPGVLSAGFLEAVYERYENDPSSVSPDWRAYFETVSRKAATVNGAAPDVFPTSLQAVESAAADLQNRVTQLVRAYRVRGHMLADLDPLGFNRREPTPELDLATYGLDDESLSRPVSPGTVSGDDVHTVGDVVRRLQNTYCRSIGVQYMHIDDTRIREWLQERMERTENRIQLDRQDQLRILRRLTAAVVFESFVQQQYVGAKSFSLEGAESLIPLLDLAFEKAGDQGIVEIVMGMAHRGRLNVLTNILGKHPNEIFREFEDVDPERYIGRGDVKYHLGHSTDWETSSGARVHISLAFNPSHLEFVNPVVLGRLRAKQDRIGATRGKKSLPLLIHGDAAFAGEGVVQETLNLSELEAYTVGGALHVVINNQIGFTTSPRQGRSTPYATDVARMLQSPIFHVNGENPEAVAQAVHLALDFRLEFSRDVVIDMYCYRRRGHNESDEPSFTQPLEYEAVRRRKSVREGYLDRLLEMGDISRDEADEIARRERDRLEAALNVARSDEYVPRTEERQGIWSGYFGGPATVADTVDTGVDEHVLRGYLRKIAAVPDGFQVHRTLKRFLEGRMEAASGKRPVDWSTAEALALVSLAAQGVRVRLTGQDSERGTFSQRHARLYDVKTGRTYEPFRNVSEDQAPVEVFNSPLSEVGVLGFEYGYSLDYPDGLVMWEAQFGDFANAAQVIIDQFVAGAEDKWNRLSGIVLLLPHGLEGTGPEHASARIERFLTLAAEDNIQLVMPSSAAQYFHCLRRQALRRWRKPLVVFTPKSLLRHAGVASLLTEFQDGRFQEVIPDPDVTAPERVLICSGKIYYALRERRESLGRMDVAIVRLEQLYPLDVSALSAALERYQEAAYVWVQEEPANQGVWPYLRFRLGETLRGRPLYRVSRDEQSTPATGSASSHSAEEEQLLRNAFEMALDQR